MRQAPRRILTTKEKSSGTRPTIHGAHTVVVIAVPAPEGREDPNYEGGINYDGVPDVQSLIPARYNRPETSGISVNVKRPSASVFTPRRVALSPGTFR